MFITLTQWADVPEAKRKVCVQVAEISMLYQRTEGDESITVLKVDGHWVEVCEPFEQIVEWLGARL